MFPFPNLTDLRPLIDLERRQQSEEDHRGHAAGNPTAATSLVGNQQRGNNQADRSE